MKVGLITGFSNNYSTKQNPHLTAPVFNQKLSFKGDSFESLNDAEKLLKSFKNKYEKFLKENSVPKKYESALDEMHDRERQNRELRELRDECRIINETLSKSTGNEYMVNAKIVAKFLSEMDKIGQNKGFNRISGYTDVKNKLKNEFIFDSILKDRTSEKSNVPNAVLFYGPAGNGKTTFAQALAEQSLSEIFTVNTAEMEKDVAMDLIENYAKQAIKSYENSQGQKRTIIVINEAEQLTRTGSPVLDRFKKLAKNCANKYKCTLFLTTNHPLKTDKAILSKEITPFKVGLEPPDKITAKEIIDKKLNTLNKYPEDGTQKIVDELFKNPEKRYSNGNIVKIVEKGLYDFDTPTTQDYLEIIKNEDIPPSISYKRVQKFNEEKEILK